MTARTGFKIAHTNRTYNGKRIISITVCLLSVLFLIAGCAPRIDERPRMVESIKAFSAYKQKTLNKLGSFDFDRRRNFYETIDNLANRLWNSPENVPLKREKKETFEELPVLELMDRDLDGKADEFAYFPEERRESQVFGFIFDLNRDGKVDYIVFNGGPVFTKEFKRTVWMNYHWIDSNYDGKIDITTYNAIDLDDDGFLDEGISAWAYDTDFDGLIDRVEYLGEDLERPVEKTEGVFVIKRAHKMDIELKFREGFDPFINKILFDINSMMP
jgi:hypothetical protein